MNMMTHLHIVGVLLIVLAVMNLFVPGRFKWREEMEKLSLFNRQVFRVHAAFIILVLVLFAGLLLGCAKELMEPNGLARAVLSGLLIFWFARMLVQWFYYSPRVWRGNRFYTSMHVIFSIVWIYFTATFAWALYLNLQGAV